MSPTDSGLLVYRQSSRSATVGVGSQGSRSRSSTIADRALYGSGTVSPCVWQRLFVLFFAKELGVCIAASDVAVIIAAFRCVVQDRR